MDLSPYVSSVRAGLTSAAVLADDHTQQVAEKLGSALDSATRLALVQALSDAASRISADLAPGSVDVRMVGSDPEFVVTPAAPPTEPTLLMPAPAAAPTTDPDLEPTEPTEPIGPDADEPVARISLRLPNSVKAKVDELADEEGISTNAWLTRAIMDAIGTRRPDGQEPPRAPQPPPPAGFPFDQLFGPEGVLAAGGGVFGPYGPFGDRGRSGNRGRDDRRDDRRDRRRGHHGSGSVQGWVR